ncbi:MAG: 4-(cytidine 5'-diphospho)-2-C-methyl-D-erythritol kinase [Acidobacteriota bacterium]|nr:4-(cytidine 5'-diphospho)-2-C-methyl-D-erythritol kinase [Acidobacteriota bacterium]
MATVVRSHAKINLGLYIGALRADGFHGLATVYQTLEVHDFVTVEARLAAETRIRLTSNDKRVPTDERNTAYKMVALALEAMGVSAEVNLHIEKRLPVQGGMGAGSANAVAALIGLEAELLDQGSGIRGQGSKAAGSEGRDQGSGLSAQKRLELAAQVGSDVPLFLVGGAVLGEDRGQVVTPLPDFEPLWCVVALPEVGVSTPQAFRDWDALCARDGLTQEASAGRLKELSRAYAGAFSGEILRRRQAGFSGVPAVGGDLAEPPGFALVQTGITSWIENDFEKVVFRQHPSLAEIKRVLAADGTLERAVHAELSGSGSALYGLYRTREGAEAAEARLKASGVASLTTRTLPRAAYWRDMLKHED